MLALSMQQPYAKLILRGVKAIRAGDRVLGEDVAEPVPIEVGLGAVWIRGHIVGGQAHVPGVYQMGEV